MANVEFTGIASKYPYPYLECVQHQGPQMSFIICNHVLAGEVAVHLEECSTSEPGELLCSVCITRPDEGLDDFQMICASHAKPHLDAYRAGRKGAAN
jgi:hypothetical protein